MFLYLDKRSNGKISLMELAISLQYHLEILTALIYLVSWFRNQLYLILWAVMSYLSG